MKALARILGPRLASIAWNGIAGAIPRVALLVAGLYVAQRFGADAFARYSLAIATVAVAGNLPGASLTTAGSKFVPEFAQDAANMAGGGFAIALFSALLAAVAGIGVWLLAPALAALFPVEPPIIGLLEIAAFPVAAAIASGGWLGLLVGAGRFRATASAQLVGFAVFAAVFVPLSTRLGFAGALVALGAHYLTTALVALATSRHALRPYEVGQPLGRRFRRLVGFFVPAMVSAGLITPVVWLANAMLARGVEPLVELSRFNAAYSWFAVVSFVPAVLAQVEFVRLSHLKARGEVRELAGELRRFTMRNAQIMVPLCATLALFAAPAMALYRSEGVEAVRSMQLLMGTALFASLGNPAGLFLAVIDRIWLASVLNVGWGIITLAACWLLRDMGAVGTTTAFLLGYFVHFAVASWVARRLVARTFRQ